MSFSLTMQGQRLNPCLFNSNPMLTFSIKIKLKNSGITVSSYKFQLHIS